ncbi:hypothetical protein Tco_0333130 [Tanacetum coccineum]
MIGSLLYLTANRLDIMFSVCLCARFQEASKTSHLEAVKRIVPKTLKALTHLGVCILRGPRWLRKKKQNRKEKTRKTRIEQITKTKPDKKRIETRKKNEEKKDERNRLGDDSKAKRKDYKNLTIPLTLGERRNPHSLVPPQPRVTSPDMPLYSSSPPPSLLVLELQTPKSNAYTAKLAINLPKTSTSGTCTLRGSSLRHPWFMKKQTALAISATAAE